MQLKKQLWGYNLQEVALLLADNEKQEAAELQKIKNQIHACWQKNQQRITNLGHLLQQAESYREQEQEITEQLLEQIKRLADIRQQTELNKNAAQKELQIRLDKLSNSYRLIDDIKKQLVSSHNQLAYLKQSESLTKYNQEFVPEGVK